MRILLVRPVSPNERFGLGPFFKVEPLGLEYLAAELLDRAHEVRIVDLRFSASLIRVLRSFKPELVGISCTHAVDIPAVLGNAETVKEFSPSTTVVVGGHSASVFPAPFENSRVDAVCLSDGEGALPDLVDALATDTDPSRLAGWHWISLPLRRAAPSWPPGAGASRASQASTACFGRALLPARHLVEPFRKQYLCVHKQPVWAVETARGCPFRCNFCSTWRRHERSFRHRDIESVCQDLARVGNNVFIVDDLFFYPADRSVELAQELRRRGIRKDWMLVQSRLDTVARHPKVVEAWRPLARQFDIFFGFEAATDSQLEALNKDSTLERTEEAVRVARRLECGVTGNFVVDPEWTESDFESMWALVDRLGLERLGYTVLTPLPGTQLYDQMLPRLVDRDFEHYDMHHVLFEPRLGRQRFFELFVESWRRNVLSASHSKRKWWRWLLGLSPSQMLSLARVLIRTQRLLNVDAYVRETFPLQLPALPDTVGSERRATE